MKHSLPPGGESTYDIIRRRHGRTDLNVTDLWAVINEQEAKLRWVFCELDMLRKRFAALNVSLGLRHDVEFVEPPASIDG